jgi:hypothetical protein
LGYRTGFARLSVDNGTACGLDSLFSARESARRIHSIKEALTRSNVRLDVTPLVLVLNADKTNACRNTSDHSAETRGRKCIDPTAAIAAIALWSTSVPWQAPPLRKSPFFAPVRRDSSGFRLDAVQEARLVKKPAEVHPGRVARVKAVIRL